MSHPQTREQRKAYLLYQIQQQRLDLTACHRDWLAATARLNHRWQMLQRFRLWVIAGSSVMAIWSIRHPRFLLRWTKRGVAVWSSWRIVKKLIRQG
ncbi:YqjK-like family protein [Enterobacteriaceae bacterium ESL0689]|nr:YqjK-like family protein [Enterobacteriaceae bacterium ESL0689]